MTILSDGCPDIFRLVHLLLPPSLLGLLEEEDEEEVEMAAYWPITGGLLRPIALLLNCGRASKAGPSYEGQVRLKMRLPPSEMNFPQMSSNREGGIGPKWKKIEKCSSLGSAADHWFVNRQLGGGGVVGIKPQLAQLLSCVAHNVPSKVRQRPQWCYKKYHLCKYAVAVVFVPESKVLSQTNLCMSCLSARFLLLGKSNC